MNDDDWAPSVVAGLSGILGTPDLFSKEDILEILTAIVADAPVAVKMDAMAILLTIVNEDKDNI